MRREERVTVQGPVKEQQPDGMSHGGVADSPPPSDPLPLNSRLHRARAPLPLRAPAIGHVTLLVMGPSVLWQWVTHTLSPMDAHSRPLLSGKSPGGWVGRQKRSLCT